MQIAGDYMQMSDSNKQMTVWLCANDTIICKFHSTYMHKCTGICKCKKHICKFQG